MSEKPLSRYDIMHRAALKQIFQFALDETGNVQDAAVFLGKQQSWVYRRCRDLGISLPKRPYRRKEKRREHQSPADQNRDAIRDVQRDERPDRGAEPEG
jgi:hypothetical protein